MRIELLHVPDCPNLELARRRLAEALAAASVNAEVHETVVTTPEEAGRAGMQGSPTILVNGRDPFAHNHSSGASLSCRLYRTAERLDGAPTIDQLAHVLSRTAP